MTAQVQSIIATLRENAKRKVGSKTLSRKYQLREDGDLAIRLAPQAVRILEALYAEEKPEMTEAEILDVVNGIEKLSQKQENSRIWAYYRKTLLDSKFLVEIKKTEEPAVVPETKNAAKKTK